MFATVSDDLLINLKSFREENSMTDIIVHIVESKDAAQLSIHLQESSDNIHKEEKKGWKESDDVTQIINQITVLTLWK